MENKYELSKYKLSEMSREERKIIILENKIERMESEYKGDLSSLGSISEIIIDEYENGERDIKKIMEKVRSLNKIIRKLE